MFNTMTKIKRKYTERLLSHWYPGFSIFPHDKYCEQNNKKTESFSDFFSAVASYCFWLVTKPTLFFLTFFNTLSFFFKKKQPVSETKAYKIKKATPKIIAIGNLTLGGSGKTPTTICMVRKLLTQGIRPAVITRGYKGEIDRQNKESKFVDVESPTCTSKEYGDEPCLIAETGVPVCVGDRSDSFKKIYSEYPNTDIILLDDGFQQKKLQPDKKVLVIDNRLIGNGRLFPYGPLREKPPLNYEVDGIILNTISEEINYNNAIDKFKLKKTIPVGQLKLKSVNWKNIKNQEFDTNFIQNKINLNFKKFEIKPLAVAGIAVPDRFFKLLKNLDIDFDPLWLDNHDVNFTNKLIEYLNFSQRIVLMTEKDGVRMVYSENRPKINIEQIWILKLNLTMEPAFIRQVTEWI